MTVLGAKDTKGKPNWSLVSLKNLEGICHVREFGVNKYKDPSNWKKVPPADYYSAAIRHLVQMQEKGLYSTDEESGLLHVDHALTNLMFIRGLWHD